MKAVNVVKTALWIAFLTGISTAGIKYVAVVETDVDAQSGASAEINPAEVREITAELRRQATIHLPPGRYSVMTSETVQSMGGAVLEECAEENCVIALGSRIGADYIVRGTISKFQTRFTLAVEMYETDNGTLVISSEAIRSKNLEELLDKASVACANMYKTFAETQGAMQKPTVAAADDAEPKAKPKKEKSAPKPKAEPKPKPAPKPKPEPGESPPMKLSAGGGAFFANGFGGGIKWPSGEAVAMPYSGWGAYLFLDAVYAEAFAGFSTGGGRWKSAAAPSDEFIPDMRCAYINIGVFAKYPVGAESVKLFPLLGIDYEASVSAELVRADGSKYVFDGNDGHYAASALSALWVKFGGGVEFDVSERVYLRGELLYGFRTANDFETDGATFDNPNGTTMTGQGVAVRVGVGVKF